MKRKGGFNKKIPFGSIPPAPPPKGQGSPECCKNPSCYLKCLKNYNDKIIKEIKK